MPYVNKLSRQHSDIHELCMYNADLCKLRVLDNKMCYSYFTQLLRKRTNRNRDSYMRFIQYLQVPCKAQQN